MTQNNVDICVIEDDPSQRALLVQRLLTWNYSVVQAEDGGEGLRLISRYCPKVVICDVKLPELDGLEICRRVRSDPTLDGIYFVLVTAHHSSDGKQAGLNAGADDYLHKPFDPGELRARIRNGMRFHRLQQRLEKAALTDGLTGLWNHTQFRRLLDQEFMRTRRYGGIVSLVMVDLDHFKAINDTFGHEAGNQVLRMTAHHLSTQVRETDYVARYGGEEFAIICPETDLRDAAELAERMRRGLAQAVRLPHQPQVDVRASFGVASSSDSRVASVADLLDLGDRALYKSKRNGRDCVTRCDQLSDFVNPIDQPTDEVDRLRKEIYSLTMRSKELCLQSVWALIQALDARDRYSAWHSRNVTQYTKWLVKAAGWSPALRLATANAAMLHDLGKIGLPDELLVKPRPLAPQELAMLRDVPLTTCRILEPLRVFETETLIIRHVREHYDGSGYPDGLAGVDIPIGSRMLAIAEAFDSMTCNRAYRPGRTIDDALEEILAQSGKQFDPEFAQLLARTISEYRPRWQQQIDRARVELPDVAQRSLAG